MRGFWALLETATNERQQAMFRMLNTHLKHLAERVEAAVGELLEVIRAFASLPGPPSSASYAGLIIPLGQLSCTVQQRLKGQQGTHSCTAWRSDVGLH